VQGRSLKVAAITAAATLAHVSSAGAQDVRRCLPITRSNVVTCAESASYSVKAQSYAKDAAEARRVAVSPLLPSNPVLSVLGGRRWQGDLSGHHWSASLAQEVELAGQRGVRRDAAQADVEAQSKRVGAQRREVAAAAWMAYFEAISTAEEQRLAVRLAEATQPSSSVESCPPHS
jgi:cobalt-zinc-cadmium efflux system outer membrane protein